MSKAYLAGPMRGYVNCNRAAFDSAAERWRAKGWEVINPIELDLEAGIDFNAVITDDQFRACIERDLIALATCDAIVMLPGWENSEGANIELTAARKWNLNVIFEGEPVRKLIAFAGYARAGKTTAADIVEQYCIAQGHKTYRLSFAGPLKEGLERMGITKAQSPDLYRAAAQFIGTDVIRKHNPKHWIDLFEQSLPSGPGVAIADDVRFSDEAECIARHHGVLFYIDAQDRLDLSQPMYRHESELFASLLAQDCGVESIRTIDNNADEASFIARVEAFADATLNDAVTV